MKAFRYKQNVSYRNVALPREECRILISHQLYASGIPLTPMELLLIYTNLSEIRTRPFVCFFIFLGFIMAYGFN